MQHTSNNDVYLDHIIDKSLLTVTSVEDINVNSYAYITVDDACLTAGSDINFYGDMFVFDYALLKADHDINLKAGSTMDAGILYLQADNDINVSPLSDVQAGGAFLFSGNDIDFSGDVYFDSVGLFLAKNDIQFSHCDLEIDGSLFVGAQDVYFEGAYISSPHIYASVETHVHISEDAFLSAPIEYIERDQFLDLMLSHSG